MPFPDIRILNRLIDDYLEIRQPTWTSTTAALKNTGAQIINKSAQVFSAFSSALPNFFNASTTIQEEAVTYQDDATVITNICEMLKGRLPNLKTMDHWINLIFDLGDEARKAQGRSQNSLLCKTMHALRTYVVANLQGEAAYQSHLSKLAQEKETLALHIDAEQSESKDVSDLEHKRATMLLQLADLGHDRSMFECRRVKLFDLLAFPPKEYYLELAHTRSLAPNSEININKPWCYQKNYYLDYHDKNIKPLKMERFDDFIQRALRNGKLIDKSLDATHHSLDAQQSPLIIHTNLSPHQQNIPVMNILTNDDTLPSQSNSSSVASDTSSSSSDSSAAQPNQTAGSPLSLFKNNSKKSKAKQVKTEVSQSAVNKVANSNI